MSLRPTNALISSSILNFHIYAYIHIYIYTYILSSSFFLCGVWSIHRQVFYLFMLVLISLFCLRSLLDASPNFARCTYAADAVLFMLILRVVCSMHGLGVVCMYAADAVLVSLTLPNLCLMHVCRRCGIILANFTCSMLDARTMNRMHVG